jgi:hypothetical protein
MGRYPYFRTSGWETGLSSDAVGPDNHLPDDHLLEHLPGTSQPKNGSARGLSIPKTAGYADARRLVRISLLILLDAERARRWATGSGTEDRRAHSPSRNPRLRQRCLEGGEAPLQLPLLSSLLILLEIGRAGGLG